jgi:hypothetical protein
MKKGDRVVRKKKAINTRNEWFYSQLEKNSVTFTEVCHLLNTSQVTMYSAINKPDEFFSISDLTKLSARFNCSLSECIAWCVGISPSKMGKGYWFE